MIGRSLCQLLIERGAIVVATSLDRLEDTLPSECQFVSADLRNLEECKRLAKGADIVFHLAGVTGSPRMTLAAPSTFFVSNLLVNTNMLEAATFCGVKKYLYTSTYGVYGPVGDMTEEGMWDQSPSEADKYAGWAKRMGELQVEANREQYDWQDLYIVRPANVYGPGANFDPENSMVVASLIRRVLSGGNPLTVWGDGSAVRDFIFSEDVARGMIFVVENDIQEPLNLGSGIGTSIAELVKVIVRHYEGEVGVVWDESKPTGDKKRILDMTKCHEYGFTARTSLESGIKTTMTWYDQDQEQIRGRFNAFREAGRLEKF